MVGLSFAFVRSVRKTPCSKSANPTRGWPPRDQPAIARSAKLQVHSAVRASALLFGIATVVARVVPLSAVPVGSAVKKQPPSAMP